MIHDHYAIDALCRLVGLFGRSQPAINIGHADEQGEASNEKNSSWISKQRRDIAALHARLHTAQLTQETIENMGLEIPHPPYSPRFSYLGL